jgi:hypothetical protein
MIALMPAARFRLIGAERADEWVARGHKRRHFFAHRLFQLPKCAPDGFRVAQAMCGLEQLDAHWQLLLYADPALVEHFPRELFFDDELIWHQQQLGRPGQVATAAIAIDGDIAHSMVHHADLVQRIGRVREHKTQIEKQLGGWPWMVLNAVLAFASERGLRAVRMPRSPLAMAHTDRARTVQPYLFERVYDRPVAEIPGALQRGEWWEIDLRRAREAIVMPVASREPIAEHRTVCVFHDLERGLGHRDEDPELARDAERHADRSLEAMLEAEAAAGARVTYNVVGQIFGEVSERVQAGGHALAFHSYDHGPEQHQLQRCRELDYRLKGYRLPKSRLTAETTDERLAYHNFEWLAGSPRSVGADAPALRNRLVRLPVALDDYSLYTGALSYEDWEAGLLERVRREPYTAVGLHDCYAGWWLKAYPRLLERLAAAAELRTLDEVSADAIIHAAA